MGVNEIDCANTEKSFMSELAQSFSDSTRIMKRVFIVLAALVFVFFFIFVMSSRDRTTVTDLDHPFYMSSGDTFTVQTKDGTMDFALVGMQDVKTSDKDQRRVLLTYNYQVTNGSVDISKLASAASYIDDNAYAYGVDIVPYGDVTDISYMNEREVMDKPEVGALLIDIPKDTKCIYTDIGASMSSSGRSSFVIYDIEKQLGKAK